MRFDIRPANDSIAIFEKQFGIEVRTVVSVVTGNGLKDVDNAIRSCGEPISLLPDMAALGEEFRRREIPVE